MRTCSPLSNRRFSLLILLSFFSIILFFRVAIAADEGDECGNTADTRVFFSSAPIVDSVSRIQITPDIPVGSVIATAYTRVKISCTNNGNAILSVLRDNNLGSTADPSTIYTTQVPGVGMRMIMTNIVTDAPTRPATIGIGTRLPGAPKRGLQFEADVRVELIRTSADNINGKLGGREAFQTEVDDETEGTLSSTSYFFAPTIITSVGCTVTTKNIEVPMGCATADQIAGKTPGILKKGLTIWLNCAVGTRASITFADSSNTENHSDILSLSKSSTAQGVGIRMTGIDNTPVFYGYNNPLSPDTFGQKTIAASAQGGPIMIPLNVSYVPTGQPIIPGSVHAIATFTLGYR